jgi:parallel beta-helix repeat protein
MVAAVFAVGPMNIVAEEEPPEEPGDPLEEDHGWWIEANGTYFEITNSSYLNITFTSSENIHLYLDSIPRMISYHIERNCTVDSTDITISGFEASMTYYRYQDGDLQEEFTTDETGSYSYTQDISTHHHVFIQEMEATIYIRSDGTIDPSTAPIDRDGDIYTLTDNIYESIFIYKSGITLDGAGYIVWGSGPGPGNGIYLSSVSGVTIKNLNIYFSRGITLYDSNGCTVSENTIPNSYLGISLIKGSGHTIRWNTVSAGLYGIYLRSYSDYNTIDGNTVSSNDLGIYLANSRHSTVSVNTVSARNHGIYLGYSDWGTVRGNTVSDSQLGIYMWYSDSAVIGNTVSATGTGIYLFHYDGQTVSGNTISSDYLGIFLSISTWVTLSNNAMTRGGIQIVGPSSWHWNTHTIDSANTVGGKPVQYRKFTSGETIPTGAGQVILASCSNMIVENQDISDVRMGIVVVYGSGNTIRWNTVSAEVYGIYLYDSDSNTIDGNTVSGGGYYGIYLYQYSNGNTISGNTVSGWDRGISLRSYSNGNTISGNMVLDTVYYGIYLTQFNDGNTISGNTVLDCHNGIRLTQSSDGNTISDNTFSDNSNFGIHIETSDSITITGNTVSGNTHGIYLHYSNSDTITGNMVWINSQYGIRIYNSNNNDIFHNEFIGNTNQLYNSLSTNTWDNGAGEGNFWSDYTGLDDGSIDPRTGLPRVADDGVGDTDLPHQEVDWYPIMSPWSPNTPPWISTFTATPSTSTEGTPVVFTVTAKDAQDDPLTYSFDFDSDGVFDVTGPSSTATFTYYDDYTGTATVQVSDSEFSTEATTSVDVDNARPHPTITSPEFGAIFPVGTPVTFTGAFTDDGIYDTHTAFWYIEGGGQIPGTVIEDGGSGTVFCDPYTFETQGVFYVGLTVTDDDASTVSTGTLVVIYDPSDGFITGGGWFDSPWGAFKEDPSLTGKATFGFVAKYHKGADVPEGNAEFHFNAADLNFHSTSYDWLVIAGFKGMFKGRGTINDEGDYGFMITAIDGDLHPGWFEDRIRVRIWDYETEEEIYDSNVWSWDDYDDPDIPIQGQIKIHKG